MLAALVAATTYANSVCGWVYKNPAAPLLQQPTTKGLSSFERNCKLPGLKKDIMTDIKNVSLAGKFTGFETVKDIYLESELFTAEKGFFTYEKGNTPKLKRINLREAYQSKIDDLFTAVAKNAAAKNKP